MLGAHLKLPLRQRTLHAPTGIQDRLTLSCSRDLLVLPLPILVLHGRSLVTVMNIGKIIGFQWSRHQKAHGTLALPPLPLQVVPEDQKAHILLLLSEPVILRRSIKIGGGGVREIRRWKWLHPQATKLLINGIAGVDQTSDRRMSVVGR